MLLANVNVLPFSLQVGHNYVAYCRSELINNEECFFRVIAFVVLSVPEICYQQKASLFSYLLDFLCFPNIASMVLVLHTCHSRIFSLFILQYNVVVVVVVVVSSTIVG